MIFLTAKGELSDKVNGLRLGAEDYIVKPFEIMELLARIEVVLRRYKKLDRMIRILGLEIDTDSRTVLKDGVGGGCGDEAIRVVKAMPKWTPGSQRGKPVKVFYTLPVTFKLQ